MSAQQNINKVVNLTVDELEECIEIILFISVVKLPAPRRYWNKYMECTFITDEMAKDHWEETKNSIHFNDNTKASKYGQQEFDRLQKLRPLLDKVKEECNAIPMDNYLSTDEQMLYFKGKVGLKQYVPSKPHKWG